MNKTIFVGRTTKDIEVKYTQGSNPMAIGKFSIAVDSGYGDKKKTNFFNCTAFGKTAETFEKYVLKGTKICIECEANQNQYTDKNGNKINTVDFIVRSFEFCESRNSNDKDNVQDLPINDNNSIMPQNTQSLNFYTVDESNIDDDLPF